MASVINAYFLSLSLPYMCVRKRAEQDPAMNLSKVIHVAKIGVFKC
jgi:hypothetical protein